MTREEAYRLAMRACEETWNKKTCNKIKEALEQEPKTGHWIAIDDDPHEENVINKIRELVDEWQSDTWTDNLSCQLPRT